MRRSPVGEGALALPHFGPTHAAKQLTRSMARSVRFAAAILVAMLCGIPAISTRPIFNSSASADSEPSVYAITGAKIFTLASAPIENGTVIIRDGKITAAGTNINIPAEAKVIDAKGLEVYPGFFDPITQTGLTEISAVRATNDISELGDFNPDIVAMTAVNPESAHIAVTALERDHRSARHSRHSRLRHRRRRSHNRRPSVAPESCRLDQRANDSARVGGDGGELAVN